MGKLTGKVAVVTGASKGTGAAIAKSLAAAGAQVVVNYSSSKEGADKVVAEIRVNTIAPGGVETEGTHRIGMIGGDFEKSIVAQTPMGRIGQPGDIAKVAVFLASDDAAWLTGERISASGGLH